MAEFSLEQDGDNSSLWAATGDELPDGSPETKCAARLTFGPDGSFSIALGLTHAVPDFEMLRSVTREIVERAAIELCQKLVELAANGLQENIERSDTVAVVQALN